MPVPTKVGRINRHGHHVSHSGWDVAVAAGAHVVLVGLVGLNETGLNLAQAFGIDHPKNIQMMSARNTTVAAPTYKMSVGRRFWGRLGSNPTTERVGVARSVVRSGATSVNLQEVRNLASPPAVTPSFRCFAKTLRLAIAGVALVFGVSACTQAPELPEGADAQLVEGRNVWQARCATCHGPDGGGGTGPRLNEGRVLERFADPADQAAIIKDGKGNMPSFSSVLTEEEIEAVIRYTREIL